MPNADALLAMDFRSSMPRAILIALASGGGLCLNVYLATSIPHVRPLPVLSLSLSDSVVYGLKTGKRRGMLSLNRISIDQGSNFRS